MLIAEGVFSQKWLWHHIIKLFISYFDYLTVRLTVLFYSGCRIFSDFPSFSTLLSSCTHFSVPLFSICPPTYLYVQPSQWRACTPLWKTLIVQTSLPLWRVRLHSQHLALQRRVPVDSSTATPPCCPPVSSMVRHTNTSNITQDMQHSNQYPYQWTENYPTTFRQQTICCPLQQVT